MSMCGVFYTLSDDQLERLLSRKLDYAAFLASELSEKPLVGFSDAEYVWFELTDMLSDVQVRGVRHTEVIPEATGYAFSGDVRLIAWDFDRLTEGACKSRYGQESRRESFDTLYAIALKLREFYARAAERGEAVLFRVT